MNVHVLRGAHVALREITRAHREHMALLRHFESGFGGFTADYFYTAGRTTMVVDGAALAAPPAKNQSVIRRSQVHQVAAISLRRKLRELLDLREVKAHTFQAVGEQVDWNALIELVQFGEPLFQRDFHKRIIG